MAPRPRRQSDTRHTDEGNVDRAREDSRPASDPAVFIEPAPKNPNDTPLDKEREQTR